MYQLLLQFCGLVPELYWPIKRDPNSEHDSLNLFDCPLKQFSINSSLNSK